MNEPSSGSASTGSSGQPAPGAPAEAPLPSDRDQDTNSTDGVPSDKIRQGSQDLQHGLKDTSRGEASDSAYQKQK